MYRFCPIVLVYVISFCIILFSNRCEAAVTITPASGLCLNNSPGAFSAIGLITIVEGNLADFAAQTNATLILTVPSGFEFLAGTGNVSYQAGRNISAASIVVSSTTITVTYTTGGVNKSDRIVISAVQARGLVAGSSGTILRTATGGTATISGDAPGAGVNHGTLTSSGTGISVTSIANGNWSSPATWSSGSVPSCGQDITISHTVTADATSSNSNLTIATGGNLVATNAITVSSSFTITGTGTYTHNNASDASTTIFGGTENFASTSTLVFNQWYNLNVPLATMISNNLGNITFNVAGTWQQDGYFAPSKVQGNIIISAGSVVLDDGTGMSTSLSLQDITITGTGNLTVSSGANRNLTLTTGDFTDSGTGGTLTSVMLSCTGILNWTVNGDVTLNDNFSLADNSGSPAGTTMTVNGDMDITGGNIDFLNSTNSALTLTVTGNTAITGSPGYVNLVNSGSGMLTFISGSMNITAAATISFISGSFSGNNQFTIGSDLIVSGASTIVYIVNISGYSPAVNLTTGRDILITDSDFFIANSDGEVNLDCGRHLTITGTAEFNGQTKVSNASLTDLTVSGTLSLTTATFYHTQGEGNIILTVAEAFIIDNGVFYGINHTTAPAVASAVFNFQDFTFLGGTAKFFNLKTSTTTVVEVNCSNNFDITWESNSDYVELVPYGGNNDASLELNVGGNFSVSGNYSNAYFLSSNGIGDEQVDIAGNFSVAGGKVFFVSDNTGGGADDHNIVTDIGGNLEVSGGETFLSARNGTATITTTGDVIISGGTLNMKWLQGVATLTVDGNYNQTGGTFNMHSNTSSTSDTCKVIVNGDFSQTGGTYNFDNALGTGMPEHTLTCNGASFTVGGTAIITHVNNLTTNYVFGHIYFNRTGTTIFSRTSSTHNIEHVRQTINTNTTVNASGSANGFQMTSMASSTLTIHNALTINGTLDMGDKILTARQQASYYSRLTLNAGARYRTSHTGGLYSGSNSTPSSIDGYISTLNRTNYYLSSTSTVEYYGTSTSAVTGVPNGIATNANQQYGILEINFTGTAGSTWVYPETTDEVHIRNSLILTAGEFNLDNDHVTTGGGRAINMEAGSTASRTAGYIRSETEDGSGVVKWNITSNSTKVFHFGYDASDYIPFTFQQTSGTAGIVEVGTYRTLPDNSPLPPTVTHVRDVFGNDNSAETVDRFWNITVPGVAIANLTYTYAASEGTGIISPRAQLWEPVGMGWYPPTGVQSNPTAASTTAGTVTAFNTWWTLSSLANPLPVELGLFDVTKSDENAEIKWTTYSEINNDYFTVEKSKNGIDFSVLEIVPGAGNTNSVSDYKVVDTNPFSGMNYYRLRQTDYDGKTSFSDVRSIYFGKPGVVTVHPNPLNAGDDIHIEVPDKGVYNITISDLSGRALMNTTMDSGDSGLLLIQPDKSLQNAGVYSIIITGSATSYSQKLVVTK